MNELPLIFKDGHVFVELDGELWLLDTGAPVSFGTLRTLSIAGKRFNLDESYLGLTAEELSVFVSVRCVGLLGTDVLKHFDHIYNISEGTLTISTGELFHRGRSVALQEFMGIPIVNAQVMGKDYRMFFDTGAQISYFQDDSLMAFAPAGRVTDFYPGLGQFQTDIYEVPVWLDGVEFIVRCGRLPELLGATLKMANTSGILGNQLLLNRTVGYFPRRHMLVL